MGARSGQSIGGLAKKGIDSLKAGAQAFNDKRKELGSTKAAVGHYGGKVKDFIKNDALNLANKLGGKAIDYARENPGKALSRVAGGVAGGFLGGAGGAFTGQAAGGRIASGVENIAGAAKKFAADRKTQGTLGAIKGNIGQAAKGAFDVGAGSLAFGNMYGKYKGQKAEDEAFNRETQYRQSRVGKRAESDIDDDLDAGAAKIGARGYGNQYYDPKNKTYIDNDPNSDTYGQRFSQPRTVDNSYTNTSYSYTTKNGDSDFNYLQDPNQRLEISKNAKNLSKIHKQGLQGADFESIKANIAKARGVSDEAGSIGGAAAGTAAGALGAAADAKGGTAYSGKTATDYAKEAGSRAKKFFSKLRRK